MKTIALASAAVATTVLVSTSAFAQTTPPAAGATATTSTASAGMGLPGPQAAAVAGDSDHDMMVGSFAVGYMGRRSVPYGAQNGSQTATENTQAPIIGARYWVTPMLGIDAGLGFSMLGDGTDKHEDSATPTENTKQDIAPVTAFLVHAGVPLALSNTGHFSFQVIPEVNFGYATQKEEDGAAQLTITHTGLFFDVGARAGAEIHFGFIGVPQLSLQAGLGLLFRVERFQTEQEAPGSLITDTGTSTNISTTVYDNPWNIFTSNVAALYYF